MISFMSREEIQEKMIADSELPLEIAQVQAPLNDLKLRGNDKSTDPLPTLPSPQPWEGNAGASRPKTSMRHSELVENHPGLQQPSTSMTL